MNDRYICLETCMLDKEETAEGLTIGRTKLLVPKGSLWFFKETLVNWVVLENYEHIELHLPVKTFNQYFQSTKDGASYEAV